MEQKCGRSLMPGSIALMSPLLSAVDVALRPKAECVLLRSAHNFSATILSRYRMSTRNGALATHMTLNYPFLPVLNDRDASNKCH